MGIHIGVQQISFDVSDDTGQHSEDNAEDERAGAETAGPAAHDCFGGDNADVMPSEIRLPEFSEEKSDGGQPENDNMIGAELGSVALESQRNVDAGYSQ